MGDDRKKPDSEGYSFASEVDEKLAPSIKALRLLSVEAEELKEKLEAEVKRESEAFYARRKEVWKGLFEVLKEKGAVPSDAKYEDYSISLKEGKTEVWVQKKKPEDVWASNPLDAAEFIKKLLASSKGVKTKTVDGMTVLEGCLTDPSLLEQLKAAGGIVKADSDDKVTVH